jgi:hypothetical protein
MRMSIVAPAMAAGFMAIPSASATPIPSRPVMKRTLTIPAPAMLGVEAGEQAGGAGEEAFGGVSSVDPGLGCGGLVVEAEHLVEERP